MKQDKINKYSWYLFQIIMFLAFFFDSSLRVPILIFSIQSVACLLFIVWLDRQKFQYLLEFLALTELCYTIISLIYTLLVSIFVLGGSKFHIEGILGVIFTIILNIPIIANIVLVYKSFKECKEYTDTDFKYTLKNKVHKIVTPIIIIAEIIYILLILNGTQLCSIMIICLVILFIIELTLKKINLLKIISLCWLLLIPIVLLFITFSEFQENLYCFAKEITVDQIFYLLCIEPIHIMAASFDVVNIYYNSDINKTKSK